MNAQQRIPFAPILAAAAAVLAMGCGEMPLPPAAPTPPLFPGVVAQVQGVAIDAESGAPIGGALITTVQVSANGRFAPPSNPVSAGTNPDGRFQFPIYLPQGWRDLQLEVVKAGFETARIYTNGSDVVLPIYRATVIGAGQSAEFRVFLGHTTCGFESHRCRRFQVDAPAGELVDVDLSIADSAELAGLVVGAGGEPGFPFAGYQTRVTMAAGEAWVIGGAPVNGGPGGRVTITVRRH